MTVSGLTGPPQTGSGARARFLQLSSAALFGVEQGRGHPVLLLHGVTANAYVWDPVAADLATDHLVVALDQRGHGRSTLAGDGSYDAAAYARDVIEAVGALGAGPALVVGHSLGARNALEAAVRAPHAIAGVVAVDFTPFIEPEVLDSLLLRVEAGHRTFGDRAAVTAYLQDRYPRLPADAVDRRAHHGYLALPDGSLQPLADPRAMSLTCEGLRGDLAPAVRDLAVPALLVRGAESALVSPDAFERTRALRPDLDTLVVDGADHYVPEECPSALARAVRAFSEGLWGTGAGDLEPREEQR